MSRVHLQAFLCKRKKKWKKINQFYQRIIFKNLFFKSQVFNKSTPTIKGLYWMQSMEFIWAYLYWKSNAKIITTIRWNSIQQKLDETKGTILFLWIKLHLCSSLKNEYWVRALSVLCFLSYNDVKLNSDQLSTRNLNNHLKLLHLNSTAQPIILASNKS